MNEIQEKSVSTSSLHELPSLALKENCFELGEKMYHLKFGTAFGTKFASRFTNMFMEGLEKKIFTSTPHKLFLRIIYFFCIWTQQRKNCYNNFFST